jgi:hypothetical protein
MFWKPNYGEIEALNGIDYLGELVQTHRLGDEAVLSPSDRSERALA